jgi:hypothetical protein
MENCSFVAFCITREVAVKILSSTTCSDSLSSRLWLNGCCYNVIFCFKIISNLLVGSVLT